MKIRALASIALIGIFVFGLTSQSFTQANCDLTKVAVKAPKKKKKKKKKKGSNEEAPKPVKREIIETDTSKVCQTYTSKNIDKKLLSKKFAYMSLRRMAGDPQGALEHWECVYENAPGFSVLIYTDGSSVYRDLAFEAKEAGNDDLKQEYGEKALDLLDRGVECFGKEEEFYGAKAYIYELLWPNKNQEIYELYKKFVDYKGNDCDAHTIQQAVRYGYHMAAGLNKIDLNEAVALKDKCKNIAKNHSENDWYKMAEETIVYYEDYYDNLAKETAEREKKQQQNSANNALGEVHRAIEAAVGSGNGSTALAKLTEYFKLSTDADRNFKMAMYVGQSLYSKEDFPSARSAFRKASSVNPGSGEPDYFVGLMYLSSGPRCGPGTGFDSQRVLWAAFDKFKQAKSKSLAPDSAADIDKQIAIYTQYLPTAQQIAAAGLSSGQSYTIPCWINEVTTVRTTP